MRPKIALSKEEVIAGNKEMAFHPALKGFAQMQQNGDLSVIQNVGYPEPNRSLILEVKKFGKQPLILINIK
jgi:uncharacterized protein (DUF1501 family)